MFKKLSLYSYLGNFSKLEKILEKASNILTESLNLNENLESFFHIAKWLTAVIGAEPILG